MMDGSRVGQMRRRYGRSAWWIFSFSFGSLSNAISFIVRSGRYLKGFLRASGTSVSEMRAGSWSDRLILGGSQR